MISIFQKFTGIKTFIYFTGNFSKLNFNDYISIYNIKFFITLNVHNIHNIDTFTVIFFA